MSYRLALCNKRCIPLSHGISIYFSSTLIFLEIFGSNNFM